MEVNDISKTKVLFSKFATASVLTSKLGDPLLQEKLDDAKKEYFAALVLWNSVLSATIGGEVPVTHEQQKDFEAAEQKIYGTLALRADDTMKELNFLGLQRKNINVSLLNFNQPTNNSRNVQSSKVHRSDLLPSTNSKQTYFRSKVMSSLKSYNNLFHHSAGSCYSITSAQAVREIQKDAQSVLDKKTHIARNLEILTKQVCVYYNDLLDAINSLQKMIELQYQKYYFKSEISVYMSMRLEALYLKAKLLETEIVFATYTDEVIKCHKRIQHCLDVEMKNVRSKISFTHHSVKSYEILGQSYEALVDEFTRISKKIKEEKWAVEELSKEK